MKNYPLSIKAADNFEIQTTAYEPENSNGCVVIINSANAVKQSFYTAFASHLADLGYWVYTYDYRGIGKSKPAKIKGFEATMTDWAEKDYAAVLKYINQQHSNQKKIAIGHSFGGHILAFVEESKSLDAGIIIASQTGYWKAWEGKGRRMMWTLSHVLLPIASRIWGYLPAKIGLGEDLPKGIALQWARWIKSPNYFFDDYPHKRELYDKLNIPILAWSFEDDTYAPLKPVKVLLGYYKSAQITHQHLSPKSIDVKSIGHFGFFRKQFEPNLWKKTTDWLTQVLITYETA